MAQKSGLQFQVTTTPSIDKFIRYLEKQSYYRESLIDFWDEAGKRLVTRAKNYAPRWKGVLVRNIAYKTDKDFLPMWVKLGVFDNPKIEAQAAAMEWGTGLLSEASDSKKTRHFPPPDALNDWAIAHGFENGWVVARSIYNKGGLKPRRMFRRALSNYKKSIGREIKRFEKKIEKEFKFP